MTDKTQRIATMSQNVEGAREVRTTSESCRECGGNCAPECGRHPAGCMFGGFSVGYWTRATGCTLDHPDSSGYRHTFKCEGCGKRMTLPNWTTDGTRLCTPCYDEVPREPVARLDPHRQGMARCLSCHKEWRAVVPVSADMGGLECPTCHRMTGVIE